MSRRLQTPPTTVPKLDQVSSHSTRSGFLLSPNEGYELWATTYDVSLNPLLALEERHLLPLIPAMQGKAVLDLGCGTGRWLKRLVELGARPGVGVDCSAAMLRTAATKFAIAHRLARADCTRLPFGAGFFDFAICSFALSHFLDLSVVSQEFALALKPGADLVVSDVHPEAYTRGWRTAFRCGCSTVEIRTVVHSIANIREQFLSSGFDCCDLLSEPLGEPEKTLFLQAGRGHLFQSACETPAVFIARFRRNRSQASQGGGADIIDLNRTIDCRPGKRV